MTVMLVLKCNGACLSGIDVACYNACTSNGKLSYFAIVRNSTSANSKDQRSSHGFDHAAFRFDPGVRAQRECGYASAAWANGIETCCNVSAACS
ncbi:hypothetical protein ACLKA6_003650 [Drosophila palustris]